MASKIVSNLAAWGCDTTGALERMLSDEEFYEECLVMFYDDECFATLGDQLKSGDIKGAFESAHTLKGVAANLGLTPLYNAICLIVEPLRAGHCDGLIPLYDDMMAQRAKFQECLQK